MRPLRSKAFPRFTVKSAPQSRHSCHPGVSDSPQEWTFVQRPAFMSTRPTARPKTNLLKSRHSALAGCRPVKTAGSWRDILPFTHLARGGRMTVTIGRRELLAALGGAAAGWPLSARAQQPGTAGARPRIAFLALGPQQSAHLAFVDGLRRLGYAQGRNLDIDHRYGDVEKLKPLAQE